MSFYHMQDTAYHGTFPLLVQISRQVMLVVHLNFELQRFAVGRNMSAVMR